ncbi:mechanosensitive ion channel family protein [Atopomonas sediminilitoris]|uniref:mechanosensitive ion channel family protein n=1 Tax=Atopomonas sediminilitoris TaxID=2919919 RepID=UPI001F4DAA1C|nr:mechanosensitive ion channel family protein [Atopomonas sediminilitoris]MCJ8169846.1 mechanosensitive ion channel family protein [Atopomonas sediminilitoris]
MQAEWEKILELSSAWLPVVMHYSGQLTLALLTLVLGWWLTNKLSKRITALLTMKAVDKTLHGFIASLANIVLKVLLIVSVASMIGVETTSFVAAIGAAGLAIGLALQGSLSNFAGGVLILLFRPFKAGDFIEGQGIAGVVEQIQIFHTVLKTGDNKVVVVPNGALSNGTITNYSRESRRRVDIPFGIDYGDDIKQARAVLLSMAKADARVHQDPEPVLWVTELADSSVNLQLRVWVDTPNYWDVMFGFIEQGKEQLEAAGLSIPFPQRVVHQAQ